MKGQNKPFNIFTSIVNNGGEILETRLNERRHNRQRKRRYQSRAQFINNQEILNRIESLSQQITSDSFLDQFFNGSLF